MKWCFDLDGCITTNPDFFKLLTYFLKKKGNNNEVYILTARNPARLEETINELAKWGISYDQLHTMPVGYDRNYMGLGFWKKEKLKEIKPDIWFENEVKVYEKLCGVNFSDLDINIINI